MTTTRRQRRSSAWGVTRHTFVLLTVLLVCSTALTVRLFVWGDQGRGPAAGVEPDLLRAAAESPEMGSGSSRMAPDDPPRSGRARPALLQPGK